MSGNRFRSGLLAAGVTSLLLVAGGGGVQAAEPMAPMAPMGASSADVPPYARRMMTDKEVTRYRARMWAAQTDEERDRIRAEHHELMRKRADERGMTMPDRHPGTYEGAGPRGHGMEPPCAASTPDCDMPRPHQRKLRDRHHREYREHRDNMMRR